VIFDKKGVIFTYPHVFVGKFFVLHSVFAIFAGVFKQR